MVLLQLNEAQLESYLADYYIDQSDVPMLLASIKILKRLHIASRPARPDPAAAPAASGSLDDAIARKTAELEQARRHAEQVLSSKCKNRGKIVSFTRVMIAYPLI